MYKDIKELWDEYEEWCNENYKLNSKLFNEPAGEKKLGELSNLVGDLDYDFKELYSIHDGEASGCGMFFGFTFLTIDEIIDEINFMVPDNSYRGTSTPSECIKISYYESGWLPIAADGSGNFIGIDYSPDVNGKRGQVINFGRDENNKYVLSENLKEFFQTLINQIDEKKVLNSDEGVEFYNSSGSRYLHLTDFMINFKYNM